MSKVDLESSDEGFGKWQPLETCPPRKTVLVGHDIKIGSGWHNGKNTWFIYGSSIPMETPTHWMPYPKPPSENNQEKQS